MKVLWFDTETGGLKYGKNPILTLAGIVEINGVIKEEFYFKIKPIGGQIIEDSALAVNGIKREEIATFEEPHLVHQKLNAILAKYCMSSWKLCASFTIFQSRPTTPKKIFEQPDSCGIRLLAI